jgi:spore coat protein U-like protein
MRAAAATLLTTALAVPGHAVSVQQTADIKVSANVAANCTIEATDLAFGKYDPITGSQVDQTATITLTCTQGSTARVTLDNGVNFLGGRRMAGGSPAGFLDYGLFKDAGRATTWGGEEVTVNVFDKATNKATLTVYGRIPAKQTTATVGAYTDTVKATVQF